MVLSLVFMIISAITYTVDMLVWKTHWITYLSCFIFVFCECIYMHLWDEFKGRLIDLEIQVNKLNKQIKELGKKD